MNYQLYNSQKYAFNPNTNVIRNFLQNFFLQFYRLFPRNITYDIPSKNKQNCLRMSASL